MSDDARSVIHARPPRGACGTIHRRRDAASLAPHLHDAASYPGGHARELCRPRSEAEVAAVVREAASVLVVGAQSSLTGGATPFGEALLAMHAMNRIDAWTADGVTVGPGLVLRELEEALAARGLYYPPVPTFDGATVGGTVATNAAGAATFKYGTTRDWVRALTVVLASGDVLDLRRGAVRAGPDGSFVIVATDGARHTVRLPAYRTPDLPKVSAGYYVRPGMDLIDLFIGAEGTLGIVTEIELRLSPTRPAWLVGLTPVADEAAALALVAALRDASHATWRAADPTGIDVAAMEYLDARCLALLREDDVPARLGVPLPHDAGAIVLFQAELAGTPAPGSATRLTRLARLLDAHGVLATTIPALPDDGAHRRALLALREAVPEIVNRRIATLQRTVDPSISKSASDVIVPFARLGEALAAYRAIYRRHRLDHAIWGHVSDGNVHPNVLPTSAADMARAADAQLAVGQAAIDRGGCPMSEHGIGRNAVKQALLARLYGPAGVAAMRAVKDTLDPRGVLAPGVLFDRV